MISKETLQQYLFRHRYDGKTLGSGATRVAFYCKKYDRVFKYSIVGWEPDKDNRQAIREFDLSQSLPEHYKKFIPVEQYEQVLYNGKLIDVIVMPKVMPLNSEKEFYQAYKNSYCRDFLQFAEKYYHLEKNATEEFRNFVSQYHLTDLQWANIGIYQNHFVMVDAGI